MSVHSACWDHNCGGIEESDMKIIVAVLAAIMLYVLSIGPVVRYVQPTSNQFASFYAPLLWLHNNTAFDAPLKWYLGLWGVK